MERIKKSYYDDALVTNLASMLRMPKEQVIDKLWANKVLTTRVVKADTSAFEQKVQKVAERMSSPMSQAEFKAQLPSQIERANAKRAEAEAKQKVIQPNPAPAAPRKNIPHLTPERLDALRGSGPDTAANEQFATSIQAARTRANSGSARPSSGANPSSEMELSLINKGISDINPYVGTQYDVTNVETLSRLMGIPEADVIKKLSKAAFRQGINDPDAAPEGGAMGGPEGGAMGGPEGGAMGGQARYDEKGNPDPNGEYDENGQPIEDDDESGDESDGEYGRRTVNPNGMVGGPAEGIPDHDSTKPGMPLARSMRKSLSLLDVFYATPTGHSQKKKLIKANDSEENRSAVNRAVSTFNRDASDSNEGMTLDAEVRRYKRKSVNRPSMEKGTAPGVDGAVGGYKPSDGGYLMGAARKTKNAFDQVKTAATPKPPEPPEPPADPSQQWES